MISFFRVQGQSMESFCKEGDFILSSSYFFFRPQVGNVVVLRHPKKNIDLVKRIIGEKRGSYWVEGDNKDQSSDSRDFGWISRDFILGKAKVIQNPGQRKTL